MYKCMTCFSFLCEVCHQRLMEDNPADTKRLLMCKPKHLFIRTPDNCSYKMGLFTFDGVEISLEPWLESVQGVWREYSRTFMSEDVTKEPLVDRTIQGGHQNSSKVQKAASAC